MVDLPAQAGALKLMFFVYVIKSLITNYYYVGLTSDMNRRLKEHNKCQVKSTKPYAPFKLIFTEQFETRIKARDYEKFLKVRSNKEKLIKSLQ